eukprot:m.124225 g.124225  ORF g.124225 m.124225 type:complete len:250 (-) comp11149_c0_seq3:142-891(-)
MSIINQLLVATAIVGATALPSRVERGANTRDASSWTCHPQNPNLADTTKCASGAGSSALDASGDTVPITLTRSNGGVQASVRLPPGMVNEGEVFTFWFVLMNNDGTAPLLVYNGGSGSSDRRGLRGNVQVNTGDYTQNFCTGALDDDSCPGMVANPVQRTTINNYNFNSNDALTGLIRIVVKSHGPASALGTYQSDFSDPDSMDWLRIAQRRLDGPECRCPGGHACPAGDSLTAGCNDWFVASFGPHTN